MTLRGPSKTVIVEPIEAPAAEPVPAAVPPEPPAPAQPAPRPRAPATA